ncbi:MAG TPA: neocarzinostatin apoprotein domain-containing protein [Acidimicrobiales bacterium]|nr:neocarzinostatin apoprotein domain-containing protein [Acidimicrobiales bacterium]
MKSTRGLRVALSIAVLGITGISSGLVSVASASATTVPKLVVTPSTKLHNGEIVHVSGSGFTPGDAVYVVECLATAKGAAGCNIGKAKGVTISATGHLAKTAFKVSTGKIGNGKCGTNKYNLRSCAMSVGNITGGDSAVGRIAFKAVR